MRFKIVNGRKISLDAPGHGLSKSYDYWGCRCIPCTQARSLILSKSRKKRLEWLEIVDGRQISKHPNCQHGTYSAYTNYGCRCIECCKSASLIHKRKKR